MPGSDPIRNAWDRALADYLRLSLLFEADDVFGGLFMARDAETAAYSDLKHDLGENYRDTPDGKAKHETIRQARLDAERLHSDKFGRPCWDAETKLALTPAPDMTAALFKVALIKKHSLWESLGFGPAAMASITEDMARLAARPLA